ncbi:MAG: ribulose-phosphate 3-epimerase [Candidatus Lindowbacteria bacterium RIFCSPLOWO2_12_FULL_62_27]|nr:MAG: ribulose-phosphate 3-epimerase [Candidatus Lindowbacteria bacterium RIFCSPLOWO2_12_FULL_62_27]
MNRRVRVAPSILSADFSRLGAEIRAVTRAGADVIHVDVMDAHFVPNLTLGPPVIRSVRGASSLPFDVHLMMTHPQKYLEAFAKAGADWLTVHVEACGRRLPAVARAIRSMGARPGVAINPETPFSRVVPYLNHFDLLLCMTVHPGFGGQKFITDVLPKLRMAHVWISKHRPDMILSVDGGIDERTARMARRSGVTLLVAGSAVFGNADYEKAIKRVRGGR